MTKVEKIEYIINAARSVSKDTDYNKRERRFSSVRVKMLKTRDEDIEMLYNRVITEGAEKVFSKDSYKKK